VANIDKKFEKIENDIDSLQASQAKCRYEEQKTDHDDLITQTGRIDALNKDINEYRLDNKEEHKQINILINTQSNKLETISGNINQSMLYIKDMQTNARVKMGFKAIIITGVISAVIAGIILYFATSMFDSAKATISNKQHTIIQFSKQLNESNRLLRRIEMKNSKKKDLNVSP